MILSKFVKFPKFYALLSLLLFLHCFICLSVAKKFEVFACGSSEKLGIGETHARKVSELTKVVLPDEVKTSKILRLASSSNNHIIKTPTSHFVWGLNENQRISQALFTNVPRILVPQEIPKNVSLVDGSYVDPTIQTTILNFDQMTFVLSEHLISEGPPFVSVELAGKPKELSTLFGSTQETTFLKRVPTSIPDTRFVVPRSLHQFAPIWMDWKSNVISIDTTRVFDYVKLSPGHEKQRGCHQDVCFYLTTNFGLGLPAMNKTLDSRYLGFSLQNLGVVPKRNGKDVAELYRELSLSFSTKEGMVDEILNIFVGQDFQTVFLTKDLKFYAFGNNKFNMLALTGDQANQELIFPPVLITSFPSADEIKQISIGFTHTLILLQNSTVLGIGSNLNGELGRNESDVFKNLIQIKFAENEELCLKQKTCSVELIAAENEASFFVFNYGPEKHVSIEPTCGGKSYLDLDVCSMHGACFQKMDGTEFCDCLNGFIGAQCEKQPDCSSFKNCSGNGVCMLSSLGPYCGCNQFFGGTNCEIPTCNGALATEVSVCSGHGKCVAEPENPRRTKCLCDAGFQGKYCGDGHDSLVLYFSGTASNLGFAQAGFAVLPFLDSNTNNYSSITHFSANAEVNTISFMIQDSFHSFGFAPTLGSPINVGKLYPSYSGYMPNALILEIKTGFTDSWVRLNGGGWYTIGKKDGKNRIVFESSTYGEVSHINPEAVDFWFMRDGVLTRITPTDILEYTISENTVPRIHKKFFKMCTSTNLLGWFKLFLLSRDGKAYLQKGWSNNHAFDFRKDFSQVILGGQNQPFVDIQCLRNVVLLKTGGKWYSCALSHPGPGFNPPFYHLGHQNVDSFGLVNFEDFIPKGEKLLDWSIGQTHSLILSQSMSGAKKVSMIAYNSSDVQTIELAGKMEEITRVFAGHGFSYLGKWTTTAETVQQFSVCNGIPDYLTDIVCHGFGTCESGGNCTCKKEFFQNYQELRDEQRMAIDGLAYRIDISIFGLLRIVVRGSDLVSWIYPKLKDHFPKTLFCDIEKSRVEEIDLLLNTLKTVFWISLIIILSLVFLGCCGFVTILFGACVVGTIIASAWAILAVCGGSCVTALVSCIFGMPCFVCCLGRCLRTQKQKARDEFYQRLLPKELAEKDDEFGFAKIDSSYFTVEFSDYKIDSDIAAGGSGAQCFVAHHIKTHEKVFMKMFILNKGGGEGDNDQVLKEFQNEIRLLTRLKHNNIVVFHGFFFSPVTRRVGYVCEFCEKGALSNFIQKLKFIKPSKNSISKSNKKGSESEEFTLGKKINYLMQIAKGMRYLHTKGIIFRDLKPDNVLIGENDTLKITDFGISRVGKENKDRNEILQMTARIGTAFYKAPEVTLGVSDYDSKVDVFSFGIMMFEMLFETMEPFGPYPPINIDEKIASEPDCRPKIPANYLNLFESSEEDGDTFEKTKKKVETLIELMRKCWNTDPKSRPDFAEIVLALTSIE